MEIKKLHFSFETVPLKESWFLTYQRQDRGDEIVFYPSSTTNPFHLPYQLPYSAFLLNKPVKRDPESSHEQSKASSPVRQVSESSKQGEKRKSKLKGYYQAQIQVRNPKSKVQRKGTGTGTIILQATTTTTTPPITSLT